MQRLTCARWFLPVFLVAVAAALAAPLVVLAGGAVLTGGLPKPATLEIVPPWSDGITHTVTQAYGTGEHKGLADACCNNDYYALDFDFALDETVLPVAPGRVVYAGAAAGPWKTYGNIIFLAHADGYQSIYAHLNSVAVQTGDTVTTSTRLGGAGGTGGWGAHLHFALYRDAIFYNTPLGTGQYAGHSVLPEPFADCAPAVGGGCKDLATGMRLTKGRRPLSQSVPRPELPALAWAPAPTTQAAQVQVAPLRNDGPGIDLVLDSDAARGGRYALKEPVLGQGNYVLLPGATYFWRVRLSSRASPQGAEDADWGAWSPLQWFSLARPTGSTVRVVEPPDGAEVAEWTPLVRWLDADSADFYYEVQVSADPTFGADAARPLAVWTNLVHGGLTAPLNSWRAPAGLAVPGGTYYVRVRPRVQATAAGPSDPGVDWSPVSRFRMPPPA